METVTISQRFQVFIPRHIREQLGLVPRQKVHMFVYENRIALIPIRPMKKIRGFLKGLDTRVVRVRDRQ